MKNSKIPDHPLVSVIIPTYNNEKLVGKTIESAINQSYENLEIVIVDDCSSDETPRILEMYKEMDSRISVIKTDFQTNLPAKSRNLGVSRSKGDFIAFLDHDDIWFKKKIQLQLKKLRQVNCQISFAPLWQFSGKNIFLGFIYLRFPQFGKIGHKKLLKSNLIQCSSVIIRRELFNKLNGFDESPELRAVEDYDLWLRVSQIENFTASNMLLGLYRINQSSTSNNEKMMERIFSLQKKHTSLRTQNNKFIVRALQRALFTPFALLIYLNSFLRYLVLRKN